MEENRSKMSLIGPTSISACYPVDGLTCSIFGKRNIAKIFQEDTVKVASVPNISIWKDQNDKTLFFLKKENLGEIYLSTELSILFHVWLII